MSETDISTAAIGNIIARERHRPFPYSTDGLETASALSALLADRDRLQRENDNLRQIERNVQAVREKEHQRANAAEAERDRLAAEVARLMEALDAERGVSDALAEAAGLALRSHGCILLSDPPQDPWKFHRVSARLEQAITAHAARREGEA